MDLTVATWGTISGLALMFVGGLVLWAYGARRRSWVGGEMAEVGPETEAAHYFHQRLTQWFLVYGSVIVIVGFILLLWAISALLPQH
jgi:hypothetical protein